MKRQLLLLIVFTLNTVAYAQTRWTVDPKHTFIRFSVKHFGISFVEGIFEKFDGTVIASKPDLSDGKFNFAIETNSISTNEEERDAILRSGDFLGAKNYPKITFNSISYKQNIDNDYELSGRLTIRDVTKTVTFNVKFGGIAKDHEGNIRAGFSGTAVINRMDYHVDYDPIISGVGQDVKIYLNIEFIQAK